MCLLGLLGATPPRIAQLTAGVASDLLRKPPGPEEWSANDVLAHLRSCADVWGDYIVTIIDE